MTTYNIVLITIDSLRADFVGYQNPQGKNTPFLDKLSKESFVYTHAIAPGVPTFFSFPSLMTGKLPFSRGYTLGIDGSKDNKTIAEVLRQHGYTTLAVLADNPQLYSSYNYDRGFDTYDDGQDRKIGPLLFFINAIWNARQHIPGLVLHFLEYVRATVAVLMGAQFTHISGEDLNEKIVRTLKDYEHSSRPFFLWVHYQDVHYPYTSGMKNYKVLKKIILCKDLADGGRTMKISSLKTLELIKKAYRGSIRYVDEAIEDLYKHIMTRHPNTIFIITSDHGEAFMEHGMYSHEPYSLYNELIRIPLLINLPSKKRKVTNDIVSTVSIAKTICSLLGIKNETFDGTDLVSGKNDAAVNHITRILYKCRAPSIRFQIFDNNTQIKGFNELISYTTSDYKYIVEKGGRLEELYNLTTDPYERKNLINTISQKTLIAFREKVNHIA